MKKRRLVFVNNQGLQGAGGGVTILRRLVGGLADSWDIIVLSHESPDKAATGVRTLRLPEARPLSGPLWRLRPLHRARHNARALLSAGVEPPDVVVCLDCHFLSAFRSLGARRTVYLSLSCIPRQEWFGASGAGRAWVFLQYALLERLAILRADVTVVASERHKAEIRRFECLPRFTPVVLPPVFGTLRDPLPERTRRQGEPVTLLTVGRICLVKNVRVLVPIAERLQDLPCRFVIAGGGDEVPALRRGEAERRGLASR